MKKFSLSGITRFRERFSVTFVVDDEDAGIVREHSWKIRKRKGVHSTYYSISRTLSDGKTEIALAHDIKHCPDSAIVIRHVNHDCLDFRKSNLAVKGERVHCAHGHDTSGANAWTQRNGSYVCKVCNRDFKTMSRLIKKMTETQ